MAPRRTLAGDMASLWFQAPLVIGMRCGAMATAALTGKAQDGAEMNRMVMEKASASVEGATAFNLALARQGLAAFHDIAFGRQPTAQARAGEALAAAAMAPFAKRVRANARRLSRRQA
ncbi:hypothetical protein [Roseibium aestuarii]|uniref:Antifreeze protein n=1 Tax=Roseibium aestuarii TaxID=2600299 RepID=A0ABW4K3F7_9HYPH|nr:hypothetical protein [Roseibium aestuarii]